MKRLAIITTHPIQYNAPLFKMLAERKKLDIHVFYTWGQTEKQKFDPGFGKNIIWDIPLLDGYQYSFVNNTSKNPGSHHYKGIINPNLIADVENWKADAILVMGWNFKSHLAAIRYFKGKIPVLFRGDSTLLDEKWGIKKLMRRYFLKRVYRNIDFAFYVGTNNKLYFLKHGVRLDQLIHAPHAIDNERFAEPEVFYLNEAKILRAELEIKEDDIVLLFAGKLEEKKNPLFLIDLINKINSPRLKIVFVGSGILKNNIQNICESDDRIIMLDFQNQKRMPTIYRIADIFFLPSKGPGETWGLALNEAMACKKAVVSTFKTGGAIDLIEQNKNGLIINFENYEAVLNLIESALLNKEILKYMGDNSFNRIKDFSLEKVALSYEGFLNSHLENVI